MGGATPKAPGGPTIVNLTATITRTATITIDSSTNNYGAPITRYTAISTPGNKIGSILTASGGTITVCGLTASTTYTFAVYASNIIGDGTVTTSTAITTPPPIPPLPVRNLIVAAAGPTTATITYCLPTYDGGTTITSYTAYSIPGGIVGTINSATAKSFTVPALNPNTSYYFGVYATNAVGTGTLTTSNYICTDGGILYVTSGTYSWTPPLGVSSISIVMVGAGGAGRFGGGGGGGLLWANNISVNAGTNYSLTVTGRPRTDYSSNVAFYPSTLDGPGNYMTINGATYHAYSGGTGSQSGSNNAQGGAGGGYGVCNPPAGLVWGGGNGGKGGTKCYPSTGGGGGAGGYTGCGGTSTNPSAGSPGTGGAGGAGYNGGFIANTDNQGGGGVGIYGQGANGTGGTAKGVPGGGGSGGGAGGAGSGGDYGGGARLYTLSSSVAGNSAIRIIWPGDRRNFPTTDVAQGTESTV